MRTLNLKASEILIIIEMIRLGDSQYENYFREIPSDIVAKLNLEHYTLTSKEIQVLRSYCSNWINNNECIINELTEKYIYNKKADFSNVTLEEVQLMNKLDVVYSIKSKLFLKKYLMFGDVLDKYYKF
jgi:hypothetical protein